MKLDDALAETEKTLRRVLTEMINGTIILLFMKCSDETDRAKLARALHLKARGLVAQIETSLYDFRSFDSSE